MLNSGHTIGDVSYEYTSGGNFVAEFRVTDNLGLSNRMLFKVGVVESGQAVDVGGEITADQTWPTGFTFHIQDNVVILHTRSPMRSQYHLHALTIHYLQTLAFLPLSTA